MDLNQFLGNSEDIAALLANLIRVGEVTSVDPKAITARVRFQDRDNVESFDLHVVTYNSKKNKRYWTPDVGENVLCLFLPSGVESGFIIGAYYPSTVNRPASSIDIDVMEYEDGTTVSYNRSSHTLLIDASKSSGTVNVICESANVTASSAVNIDTPETTITGNVTVLKDLSVVKNLSVGSGGGTSTMSGGMSIQGGSITHDGVNIGSDHVHGGVESGGSNTGGPQ